MSQRKSYSRYFIILQEDEKGYGLASDKLPTGYAKMEVKNGKCKVSFYVQNLKTEKKPYHMMLICNKKDAKKLIKLGELNIDGHGRAEISSEFSAEDIAGTNISIDKISGASISRFVDSNMITIMSGFTSTDVPDGWKEYSLVDTEQIRKASEKRVSQDKNQFEKYEENIEKIKEREKEVEVVKEEVIEDKKVEATVKDLVKDNEFEEKESEARAKDIVKEKESETKKDKIVMEVINLSKEKEVEEVVNRENLSPAESLETDRVKDNIELDKDTESIKDDDSEEEQVSKTIDEFADKEYEDLPRGKSGKFFRNLTEELEEWDDSFEDINRCKWYKIPVKAMDDMYKASSYNKYTILYYPMVNYYPYIMKHKHYMVGYKFDENGKVKYLVYAVPGTKSHLDQPFGGKSGFVTWVQPKKGKEKQDNMGYWLMFYDFRKCVIVVPMHK